MDAPQLWLNGRQITGLASDRAPVLAPVSLSWGTDTSIDQPPPANLKFTILFLDGMHDIADLHKGSQIELVHPSPKRTIFAGSVRTMSSTPSDKFKGALELTVNATDHDADLENEYISADWIEGNTRRLRLITAFFDAGWDLTIPTDPRQSAATHVNSIKLLTLLERHITRFRGRRFDTSYRTSTGVLVKRLQVVKGNSGSVPADILLPLENGEWERTFRAPVTDGVASPLLQLDASNALLDPEWNQDASDTITAVQLSTQSLGEDGFTTLTERNYRAQPSVVSEFGLQSTDLESDVLDPLEWSNVASQWMNSDSPWQMSGLTIRDSALLSPNILARLLDPSTRHQVLVYVMNILANRPDPGPSVMRSFVMGGEYIWNGKKWELTLNLERTIYGKPTNLTRITDIANSVNQMISGAKLADIGRNLTFADFREIERPN